MALVAGTVPPLHWLVSRFGARVLAFRGLIAQGPLAAVIVMTAALLPWLTWLPTRAVLGDATPDVIQAPARLLAILPMVLIGGVIAAEDMWLGLFVLYAALWQWAQPGRFWGSLEAPFIAFGALAVLLIRGVPRLPRAQLARLLAWSGALEALYVTLSWFGVNPLGVALGNGAGGTLGHSTYAGAFLALTAPLAPLWLLPVFACGLIASHSATAIAAALIGLVLAHRRHRLMLCALGGACSAVASHYRDSLDSLHTRLWAQGFLLRDWITGSPWLGWGHGAWYERGYPLQLRAKCPAPNPSFPTTCATPTEVFDVAHNDYAQLAYTGGLVALAMLVAFLWTHRAMLASPYAGAVVALMILCAGFFPFHQPVVAATSVVVLGFATAESA